MRVSVRDLHIRTSELVREAAEGNVIVIERRGEPIADGVRILALVSERLLRKKTLVAGAMPATVFLRTGDAIHLTTAQDLGESEIWSNDRHLLAAAKHFGLTGRSA